MKYVKTKNANGWRIYWDSTTEEPDINFNDRRIKQNWQEFNSDDPVKRYMAEQRIQLIALMALDDYVGRPSVVYRDIVKKYGAICINAVGGWCPVKPEDILELITSEHEPFREDFDLVITENDLEAPPHWVEKMRQYSPEPLTIPYFGSRPQSEITAILAKAKYVTFSTTFTTWEWYEKLLEGCLQNATIIGECFDIAKLAKAKEMAEAKGIKFIGNIRLGRNE